MASMNTGRSRARRRLSTALAAGTALCLVLAACGDDDDDSASTSPPATEAGSEATTATTAAGATDTTTAGTTEGTTADTTATTDEEPATTSGEPKEPYKVRIISDLTGPGAGAIGIPGADGVRLAFEIANADGGVNGHPVDVSVIDTQSTAEGGAVAAQSAVGDEPNAIVLPGLSSGVNGALPTLQQAALPSAVTAGFDQMQFPTTPWWFSIGTTNRQYADMLNGEAERVLGGSLEGKKVAVERVAVPSAQAVSDAAKAAAEERGASITGTYDLPPGTTSFTSQAQEIVDSGAEILYTSDQAATTVVIANALKTAGFEGYILGTQAANDVATITAIGSDKYHAVRVVKEPAEGDYMTTEGEKFGITAVGPYFGQGFALGSFVVEALAACTDECTSEDFTAAAESLGTFELPGDLAFGPLEVGPDRHYFLTTVSWWTYDPATQAPVQVSTIEVLEGAPQD